MEHLDHLSRIPGEAVFGNEKLEVQLLSADVHRDIIQGFISKEIKGGTAVKLTFTSPDGSPATVECSVIECHRKPSLSKVISEHAFPFRISFQVEKLPEKKKKPA